MRRKSKIIRILLGISLLVCIPVALLFFSSGVQRGLLVYLLNKQCDGSVMIEQVVWEKGAIELQGIRWDDRKFDLAVDRLQIVYNWKLLFEDVIELQSVEADGVLLHLEGMDALESPLPAGVAFLAGGIWGLQSLSDVSLPLYCSSVSVQGQVEYEASPLDAQSYLFTLSARDFLPGETGHLTVTTEMKGVSWSEIGDEFLATVTVQLDVNSSGRIYGGRLTAASSGSEIVQTSMGSVDGVVSGDFLINLVESNILWEVPYGALFHSGMLEGDYLLRSGSSGQFDINGSVRVEQLRTIPVDYKIDRMKVDLSISSLDGKRLEIAVPFMVERGSTSSSASIEGNVLLKDAGTVFDLEVNGGPVVVEDIAMLFALGALGGGDDDDVTVSQIVQEAPLWMGNSGEVRFDLKKVSMNGLLATPDFSAVLSVEEESISLRDMELSFQEDTIRAEADLVFKAYERFSYVLNGEVNILKLTAEKWLPNPNENKKPVLEGPFSGKGSFKSIASEVVLLGEEIQWNLALKGEAGFFRGLEGKVGRVQAVAGLLGSFIRSPKLDAIAAVSVSLAEIPYEEIYVEINRDASKVMFLDEFLLQSPEILLRGRGQVSYQEGLPWDEQALRARFQLAGKGHMAKLLEVMGLLDVGRNVSGYTPMRDSFEITGTLANPDAKELQQILRKAAGSIFGSAFSPDRSK